MFLPLHDANPRKYIYRHYVTLSLIAINVIVYLLDPNLDGHAIYAFTLIPAALSGDIVRPSDVAWLPEPLTLITHSFLHVDIWHLGGNMLFLWVFGDNVEDAVGHWRFLLFYILCAVGAGLAQYLVDPSALTNIIGASGAVAGVIAAYLLLHPHVRLWILFLGRIPLRITALWALGGWIIYQLWAAIAANDNSVAWWEHVGGAATGVLLILVLRRPGVLLFDRQPQTD